ncbi:MAG: M48 family metalloprotease [Planctomycetales bacterium]|nr:M48 family metalloprotease [Planctomycetales bacterium]
MPLLLALVLVLVFAAGEAPVVLTMSVPARLGAALLLIALPGGVAWTLAASVARGVRRGRYDDRSVVRRLRWVSACHLATYTACTVALVFAVGWAQLLRTLLQAPFAAAPWQWGDWPVVDQWLMLVPVVVPIICGWLACYEVSRALALREGRPATLPSRWSYVGQRVRGQLAVLLLPVIAIISLADLAEWYDVSLAGDAVSGIVGIVVVAAVATFYPWLLRICWGARPLPSGPLRQRLESALAGWGLTVSEILIWPTDGRLANAAVAGLFPRLRYVFLTDALVDHFTTAELEAVLAHEVGHLRYRHLSLRLIAMFVPLAAWTVSWAAELLGPAPAESMSGALSGGALTGGVATFGLLGRGATAAGATVGWGGQLTATSWLPAVAVGLVMVGYMATVWAAFSRMLERQADLFACACLARSGAAGAAGTIDTERFVAVLSKLAISNGVAPTERQWQHGSVLRRADFLRRVGEDAARTRRFHRRVAVISAGVVLLGAVGALGCLV